MPRRADRRRSARVPANDGQKQAADAMAAAMLDEGLTLENNAMQSPKLPDWAVVDITKPGNNHRDQPLFGES